jgi:hypothetical protein
MRRRFVCGKVNSHKERIWGTKRPHAVGEHARYSPKPKVFCANFTDYFFFAEPMNYLYRLQPWLMPQLQEDIIILQEG